MNRQGRFWLPVHFMNGDLEQLRSTAKRLERYARRARERIWTGNRDDLINALSDVAEAGEIARRLLCFPPAAHLHHSDTTRAATQGRANGGALMKRRQSRFQVLAQRDQIPATPFHVFAQDLSRDPAPPGCFLPS